MIEKLSLFLFFNWAVVIVNRICDSVNPPPLPYCQTLLCRIHYTYQFALYQKLNCKDSQTVQFAHLQFNDFTMFSYITITTSSEHLKTSQKKTYTTNNNSTLPVNFSILRLSLAQFLNNPISRIPILDISYKQNHTVRFFYD